MVTCVLPAVVVAPDVLRYFDPYMVLSVTLTLQCVCAFVQAISASIADPTNFVTILIGSRFVMGMAMAFNEVLRGAIVTSLVSKQLAGYVQGISVRRPYE